MENGFVEDVFLIEGGEFLASQAAGLQECTYTSPNPGVANSQTPKMIVFFSSEQGLRRFFLLTEGDKNSHKSSEGMTGMEMLLYMDK